MKRYDFWKLSLLNITSSPTRSVLTVLGMAIGIGAILAVLTLGDAGKDQVQSEMARLGIDRVWITAAQGNRLTRGDADLLGAELGTTATEQAYAPVKVAAGERQTAGVAVGCSREYLRVMDTVTLNGRELYPVEWLGGSQSVLVGHELAGELGIRPGDTLSLSGMVFRCAGVISQRNEMSQVDAERAVFIPISAFGDIIGSTVHEITLSVPENMMPQAVAAMAMDVMKNRKHIQTQAVTMQVQIEAANGVMAIFVDVLKWVAIICILVGGIGVMNILLVSVRERRREIGIMKSLGASSAQICTLFLTEALTYALVGGVLGLLIGLGLIQLAGRSIGLNPAAKPGDCALVFSAAMGIGLVFGVLPASRASAMRPVDALRDN